MPRLLPRFYEATLRIEDERRIARIVDEASVLDHPSTVAKVTLPGDMRRLRGIPVCAPGVSGTSPQTHPVAALLGKDASRAS